MNQELIKLTNESIKNCEDTMAELKERIVLIGNEIKEAEAELINVDNIKQSLEAALERLEEANEKERKANLDMEESAKEAVEIEEEEVFEKVPEEVEDELVEEREVPEEVEEPEMTPEEKTKATLDDADRLIAREKKRQEQAKKGWKLCSECNSNRISPANKKGICTPCQTKRKTSRPYTKRK